MGTMKTGDAAARPKVVPLKPAKPAPKRRADERWGKAVIARGFTVLPSMLFWAQARLKLSPAQFNVVLQIAAHWWDANEDPWPSKETIAQRMGKDPRTVQRYVAQLEKRGLVERRARFRPGRGGQAPNGYSLKGLVAKLEALEPEFRKMVEQNRNRRQRVERPKEATGA
jgi:predicted transcriptional regulator